MNLDKQKLLPNIRKQSDDQIVVGNFVKNQTYTKKYMIKQIQERNKIVIKLKPKLQLKIKNKFNVIISYSK